MSSTSSVAVGVAEPASNLVRGTTETMLAKLEESLGSNPSRGVVDPEDLLQASEPGPLGQDATDVEEVLNIISQSIYREADGQCLVRLSDRTSLLSVVSHSLSAYITTLEPASLQRLSGRIAHEVSLWMCKLFKFTDGGAYCHDDTREGLVKMCRLALHRHYPKLHQDGYEALFARPPVIYLTSTTYQDTMQFVCGQLGLPQSTIRVLKCETKSSSLESEIEKIIQEDKAAGKTPILCIANVHSAVIQHGVDMCSFESMLRREDVWLHLEGNALSGLVMLNKDNTKKPIPTGDSMALTLGAWIGVPAVPFVTLYKLHGDSVSATSAGLTTLTPSVRLNCLPLWCVIRSLGEKAIKHRIENVYQMLEVLNKKLGEVKCVRVLSQRSPDDNFVPISDLEQKSFDVSRTYRTVNPALAFQYISENPPEDLSVRVPAYFNNLNSWLGQTMQRDCGQVPLEIVDVETTGYVLRLCPFESLSFSGITLTDQDLGAFLECLESQTSILNATVMKREQFIALIREEMRLEHVEISHWAGLGGVRYIPSEYVDLVSKQNEEIDAEQVRKNLQDHKDENRDIIDHRNIQLVQQLRNSDSAFSLGEGPDGRICIRFGMVSIDTDIEELLKLVIKSGLELDEQLTQLQNMSEVIQKGIQQAQGELEKESEEAIWQEGILRHVPVVGSFYNWFSPAQKSQIKGRCLSLQEGRLESTEKLYQRKSVTPQLANGLDNPAMNLDTEDKTEDSLTETRKPELETGENKVTAESEEEKEGVAV